MAGPAHTARVSQDLSALTRGSFESARPATALTPSKGSWLDDHTFVVERRILGHADTQKWILAFEGKKVDVTFESTDGAKVELHGETDE